ncbi:MAG: 3-phenylpropionate/cinnamic acid dioxygenase subunit beta [Acidimicrobiales bacterium]
MSDDALERLLLREEVTEFLHREADLLDEGRYEEWLDLLAEDLRYTMPLRLDVAVDDLATRGATTRPGEEVCWFDEGKDTLRQRVAQLRTGLHWAEEPLSRVSHLVTNVRIVAVDGDEVDVSCRFVVHRNRVAAETDFFVGRRRDTLRRVADGWQLRRRELLLDQNVLLAKNLTLLF